MSATITDYFNKASNMGGSYPAVATVTAARSTGGSTLSCDDLSSWATDTPVHFSTFKVNTDGTIDTSTQTDWKGIVNGNTITDMTRLAGAADSGNASGDRVELNPTIGWLDDLITGILVSHKQNGALKDNAVTESSIATGAVTNTKLGDGSVTSAKIGTGAISSYDKIGDDVIQARNIKFSDFARATNLNSGYYEMGDLLICWGQTTASLGTSSYAETMKTFTFPKAFSSIPMVMVSCTDVGGYVGEYTVVNSSSTTSTSITLGKVRSTDQSVSGIVRYLAVGVAASN